MEESRLARPDFRGMWRWDGKGAAFQSVSSSSKGGGVCFDGVLLTRLEIMKKYVRKTVSSIWNVGNWMYLTGKFWEVIGN